MPDPLHRPSPSHPYARWSLHSNVHRPVHHFRADRPRVGQRLAVRRRLRRAGSSVPEPTVIPEDAPQSAPRDGPPVWRLPRSGAAIAGRWLPENARVAIAPREGHLKLTLLAETVAPATHIIADRRRSLTEEIYADSHSRILCCPEYERAAGILPQHAQAERDSKAATAKLDAIRQRRERLVAAPKAGLGKELVALEAESAAASAVVAEHRAEVDALAPAAQSARAALLKAAAVHCRAACDDSHDGGQERLSRLVAEFFAANSDALTEIAVASAVRAAHGPADHDALARLLEADLVAPRPE